MLKNIKPLVLPLSIGAIIIAIVTSILISSHGFIGMPQSGKVWLSSIFVIAVVCYTLANIKRLT